MNLPNWLARQTVRRLTFAHPWLLLLLLAMPLLACLRGKSGPAAALTFSSTASSASARKTERRARRENPAGAAASSPRVLRGRSGASAARQEPHAGRSERDRHHARARRFRLDADQGFHGRRRASDAGRCDSRSHAEVHRRPAKRSHRHHCLRRPALCRQPDDAGSRLASAKSRSRTDRPGRRRHRDRVGHGRGGKSAK